MKKVTQGLRGHRAIPSVVEEVKEGGAYVWATAEGMKPKRLLNNLCDLGKKTNGEECENCISSCAFGREYIKNPYLRNDEDGYIIIPEKEVLKVQAYKEDGTVVAEFDTVKQAAEAFGYNSQNRIYLSIRKESRYYGNYWRWVKAELPVED